MFEAAELGRTVGKDEYQRRDLELRESLLALQRKVRESDFAVIILIAGVEGAGKGAVVNEINRWFDSRGVETHAFWDHSLAESDRPRYWRFWERLPPRSTIGVMFGSWYTTPIVDRALRRNSKAEFALELDRISAFERLLVEDGTAVIKFWFHMSQGAQRKQIKADVKAGIHAPLLHSFAKLYRRFWNVSETAIRATDSRFCPWHIVESDDPRFRNITVGETLQAVLEARLAGAQQTLAAPLPLTPFVSDISGSHSTILDRLDTHQELSRAEYEERLEAAQARLRSLSWRAHAEGVSTICVFEGWDAAGKGGAIRRITAAIDARLFRVISIAAPTDEERSRHYLWRFWRRLPRSGYFTIYDRSWYGRVLVERVEELCSQEQWSRAYQEINDFEQQIVEHGTLVAKFWLDISPEVQLQRFNDRARIPWKQHKITAEDWRNRERWDAYNHAVAEMVARTSSVAAPWTLVPANDKQFARVMVVETLCERLATALDRA